jgi:hypothetical protein
VDETLPVVVVDPGRLELVLMNLVSNAIKYSDPEKADRFVRIDGLRSGTGHCTLMISDNGLGIPKESQAAVFDRHVRAHADLDDAFGIRGSGLGLTIVAECIGRRDPAAVGAGRREHVHRHAAGGSGACRRERVRDTVDGARGRAHPSARHRVANPLFPFSLVLSSNAVPNSHSPFLL